MEEKNHVRTQEEVGREKVDEPHGESQKEEVTKNNQKLTMDGIDVE